MIGSPGKRNGIYRLAVIGKKEPAWGVGCQSEGKAYEAAKNG